LLKAELSLSASQLGILFAAFFTTYTAMQFVIGWVVDRFDVNRVLAAGFLTTLVIALLLRLELRGEVASAA